MADTTIKHINNPADFHRAYLVDQPLSLCDAGSMSKGHQQDNFCIVGTLEQLKSAQKKKSFGAARRNFYTMVLITSGTVQEKIGPHSYTFGANTLYFIPKNQLHVMEQWSRDVKGFHCIFDTEYFLLCLKHQIKLNEFPFFQHGQDVSLKLSDTEVSVFAELFKKLKFEYCARKNHNDDLLVRLYLNVFLLEASRLYHRKRNTAAAEVPRSQLLVTEYQQLVALHYKDKRLVSDYAALLYVTPHYLNDTIKAITGHSASEYIHDSLITEAKSLLIQTELTITQIATELNFSDQSYFCRFFKSKTGQAAKAFREKHNSEW
jgi:AraC family transcriptional regulator, transcriptional activator of pobA